MKSTWRRMVVLIAMFAILIPSFVWKTEAATTTITNGTYYLIQNVYSGHFLEVEDTVAVAGSNIWQFNYSGSDAQLFQVTTAESGISNSSGYHQLVPKSNTSLRVDVSNASNSDGANIQLFVSNGGYGAQSFKFISNGDGSFRIMPHLSSTRVLSIAGNSADAMENVQLRTWTQHDSQKWILKKVTYVNMNFFYPFHGTAATNYRRITTRFSSSHVGIDVPAPDGTALYSPCTGTVVARGEEDSMGHYVIIRSTARDANGRYLTVRMMHMNADPLVSLNQSVVATTKIGYVGNTGESYGAHLHIDINNMNYLSGSEIRDNFTNCAIQPEDLFLNVRFTYASGYTYA